MGIHRRVTSTPFATRAHSVLSASRENGLVGASAAPNPWRVADRLVSDVLNRPDAQLEVTLRPSVFEEFTGQANVRERIEIAVEAARRRKEPWIMFF